MNSGGGNILLRYITTLKFDGVMLLIVTIKQDCLYLSPC